MQRNTMKTSSQRNTLIKICLTLPPLSLAWRMTSYKKYETIDTIMIAATICGMVIKFFVINLNFRIKKLKRINRIESGKGVPCPIDLLYVRGRVPFIRRIDV